MGGKAMNPADAHRKEIRKKEIKRNKLERQKGRESGILKKDPEKIKEEIYKLESMKADGPLDIQRKHKLRQKKDELEFVLKKRKEREEETPAEKRETRVIYKDWVLPRREIGAPQPRPPPPPPPPLPVSGESRYVDDMAVISSLPVPPPPPLPPKPANILYSTFQPQPRPPRTDESEQDVFATFPPPPPPPPPTKAPAMTMPCLVPNVPPPGVSFFPSPPPPPHPPTKAPTMTMPCLVPNVSPPGISFFPPLPPPPPPPPPTHAPPMTMRNLLPSVPPREVSFVPRPPPPPPPPTMTRPPSTLKPSHIRSAAPTVVRRPLAQNSPELTSMIPASVRVRRETTPHKPRPKPLLPTLTRTSNPFGIKPKSATKAYSIDESYTAFLEDMKALGAL